MSDRVVATAKGHEQQNESAQKLRDETQAGCGLGNGMSREKLYKIETQIEQEKKPLVAVRTFEPGIAESGPWLTERVYDHGKFLAMRAEGITQWDASFHVKVGDEEYFVIPGSASTHSKDNVMRESGVKGGEPLPTIKDGTKEYKRVLQKLRSIDFDRIPDYDAPPGQKGSFGRL